MRSAFEVPRARLAALLLSIGALTASLAASCGGPEAEPIGGDLSAVLREGIEDGREGFDHGVWDEILVAYVREGGSRFDYAGLKREESKLDDYLEALAAAGLDRLSGPELETLFINAYNAYTVKTIVAHVREDGTYEIDSIRDIPNVFEREVHRVGGFVLSLDNMEHNILRPLFRDPRVHFAVNCASISCPPLPPRAFAADSLDAELETATTNVLQSPDFLTVEGDALLVTKILEWYGSDFVNESYRGAETSLPAYLRKYATDEVRAFIDARGADNVSVRFRDYDWGLNRSDS